MTVTYLAAHAPIEGLAGHAHWQVVARLVVDGVPLPQLTGTGRTLGSALRELAGQVDAMERWIAIDREGGQ